MTKTVTCLYQDQEKAAAIVSRLEQAGITRGNISFYSTSSDTSSTIWKMTVCRVPTPMPMRRVYAAAGPSSPWNAMRTRSTG
jgi:hypothetical protein